MPFRQPALPEAFAARLRTIGIERLRPIQKKSVAPVTKGRNCLIVAPTASGKTEAALFPLLATADAQTTLTRFLYIAPTKALLNNQLERLSRDLRVMRQHVLTQPLWPEQAGRVQLGLAPDNPLFAV